MKSNTLLMMYAADILDGTKKIDDVPQMLQADVLNLATHYTESIAGSKPAGPVSDQPVPMMSKEGQDNEK